MSKTVIEMAREAGVMPTVLTHWPNELKRFAELVRADEREACAKVCNEATEQLNRYRNHVGADETNACAEEIRARGNT